MIENVFFLGKGGVGKTTLACACAVRYSLKKSFPVFLYSFDPAHNIKDIINNEKVSFLWEEIDLKLYTEKYLQKLNSRLKKKRLTSTFFSLESFYSGLNHYPGMEEWILYEEFKNRLLSDEKLKIFDMPPTGSSLKMFRMGLANIQWFQALIRLRKKIVKQKNQLDNLYELNIHKEDELLQRLLEEYRKELKAQEILQGEHSLFIGVVDKNPISFKEWERIKEELTGLKMKNFRLIMNKSNNHCKQDEIFIGEIKNRESFLLNKENPFPAFF